MNGTKPKEFVRPQYPYALVERALAWVLDVGPEAQRGALRGRLKHLQRLGLPGLMTGKGTRVLYTHEQVCQWLIALLMLQVGINPTVIVRLVQRQWPTLERRCRQARDRDALAGNHMWLRLQPQLMTDAWGGTENPWVDAFRRYDYRLPARRENIVPQLDRDTDKWICVRNLTEALGKLEEALALSAPPKGA
jgi:hypothetical protein